MDKKVIVSFTTIPSHIKYIKPMVDSVLNQSYTNFNFYCWIPKNPIREEASFMLFKEYW